MAIRKWISVVIVAVLLLPLGASRAAADTELVTIVEQITPNHPRVLVNAAYFTALRTRIQNDSDSAAWFAAIQQDGEALLNEPVSTYQFPDGRTLLTVSREVLSRAYTLGLLYQVNGDTRYAERLWSELAAVSAFPDWNPVSFLSTAEMTHAFAIGYDWLYHYWTTARRDTIRQAIVNKGLNEGKLDYAGPASWVTTTSNWNIVCNAGLGMGALAIGDEVPALAEEILQAGLDSLPVAVAEYGPDGAYPEGVGSYWQYATRYLVPYIASLNTAVGDDFGLAASPGLSATGKFPIYLTGPTNQNFNYGDAATGSAQTAEMSWLGTKYAQPVYGWWGKRGAVANPSPQHLLWYNPQNVMTPIEAAIGRDQYFRHSEVVTQRSAWLNGNAVFTGFKAGDNKFNHGDLDLGTFVLDALGVRWATELGGDNYGLPGYFSTGATGQRWTYYRKRAEGQNTLVVNPGSAAEQNPLATGAIVRREFATAGAYSVADLTQAYSARGVTSWQRGVKLFDNRQRVLVQDELSASQPADVWWFMHTKATTITVSADGKSAMLTSGTQRMEARILSPTSGATFTVRDAVPLPTSPNPSGQTANTGVRKLAIHLTGVTSTRLSVLFTPLATGQVPGTPPTVTSLAQWTA